MPIEFRYGEQEVKDLAAKAGKAQAAKVQLQQRFQKDMTLMDYQFRLAAEQRARAWELEKMEIASRMDFEQQERQRLQKQASFQSAMDEIDKRAADGIIPKQVVDRAKLDVALKHYDVPGAADYLGVTPYQQSQINLRQQEIDIKKAESLNDNLTPYQQQQLDLRQQEVDIRKSQQEANSQALQDYLAQVQQLDLPAETKQLLIAQAAGKEAGISFPTGLISQTTKPETAPKQLTPDEMVSATKFLSGFSEKMEEPGWEWGPPAIIELAKVDKNGEFERPATEAEKTAYQEVKNRLATGLKFGTTPEVAVPPASQAGQTLSVAQARALLAEAGGDRAKAEELARQRGYSF
jgi:hypothetical protein